MIAGLPGKMASLVTKHIMWAKGLKLVREALSEEKASERIDGINFSLLPLNSHKTAILEQKPDIIVDFTLPRSVVRNAQLYCDCNTPFVTGTTGGDRDLLNTTVRNSNISAVIAPNMAKQIVAFQAMMRYAAENFPNVFRGYKLVIQESHQKGKADTSGTAKSIVNYFNELGIPFRKDQIIKMRDPDEQLVRGVPREYLNAHGWHSYHLRSEDGKVLFQFTHNVNGRAVYAQGTLDAIRFLAKHKEEPGRVFSMIDVLKAK